MRFQIAKLFKLAATGSAGLALANSLHAKTTIGVTSTSGKVPANFASNVTSANTNTNFTVAAGVDGVVGTPNISLAWSGAFTWDFYGGWPNTVSGGVIQMEDYEGAGLTAGVITFTPDDPSLAVAVNSVILNQWGGSTKGAITIAWSVDGTTSGNLASGTYTFPSNSNLTHPLNLGVTGAVGEEVKLTLDMTAGAGSYFAIENLEFDQIGELTELVDFDSNLSYATGAAGSLFWTIDNPTSGTTVFLDSGSGPIDVTGSTNLTSGEGSLAISPSVTTTYSLTVTDSNTMKLTLLSGATLSLTSDITLLLDAPYQATLDWLVDPMAPDLDSVSLFDGTTTIDVTADTDGSGYGSKVVTVAPGATTYTIDANQSGAGAKSIQLLRPTTNSAAFSLDSATIIDGNPVTISWTGASAGDDAWVAVYSTDRVPGPNPANSWNYLNGTRNTGSNPADGSMSFTMGTGDYYAVLFVGGGNNTYRVEQGPILFSVVTPPEPQLETTIVHSGNNITLEWKSQVGWEYDIMTSDDLVGDPLSDWELLETVTATGTTSTWTEDLSLIGTPDRRFYVVLPFPAPAQ